MTLMITEKCYIERNDVLTRQNLSNDANVRQLRDSAEVALLMGACATSINTSRGFVVSICAEVGKTTN